jgi:RNA 3'-terminal phosphate cyclase (ATP)
MLTIDGSFGEGGGQILRSSLALSILTGRPFRIEKIRAGRGKPGLMRQHLTAVRAAAEVCSAEVAGDEIGSLCVNFTPGKVRGGEYAFSIGTAGSTTLVLQTVLLPLTLASEPSRITLEGGTHNPFAPPFDFLAKAYLPLIKRMGPTVSIQLDRPGFYPAGGGRIIVDIEPARKLEPVELMERGKLVSRRACAQLASLPHHIAERELRVIQRKLNWPGSCLEIREITNSHGPGNIVTIEVEYEHVTEVFTGFGEIGRPAEDVATHAVQQYQRYIKTAAPVGEYLTDQLILPLALAGGGAFVSCGLSRHSETHLELVRQFLDVTLTTQKQPDGSIPLHFGSPTP